ncbi:MAG: aspartate racemase [Ramlibacter sp.]|jgi:aspartate racemase|nr:aspartate racemase [Ramlibacter sp.]
MQEEKIVGILGGMGPQATLDLMAKVIRATPAQSEKDHLRMLVDCNPKVPDRVAAILAGGPDSAPALVEMAMGLVGQGADLLAIACNTAHHFHAAIQAAVPVPVLDMIALTARRVAELDPPVRTVGLLATEGTIEIKLYHRHFEARGIEVITPRELEMRSFMSIVYGVKTGHDGPVARAGMAALAQSLMDRGAEAVIAGCTEVPLVISAGPTMPMIDPTQVLAESIVQSVLGRARAMSPAL